MEKSLQLTSELLEKESQNECFTAFVTVYGVAVVNGSGIEECFNRTFSYFLKIFK